MWIDEPTESLVCSQVLRKLQSHLDGMLNDATTGRVAQHLAWCQRCDQEAETYRAIKNTLAARRSTSPDVVQRLRDFAQILLDEPELNTMSHT